MAKITTDASFEADVLKSSKPVLVDFWATWCQPCQMLLPVIEELSAELSDVEVVKINIDENPEAPTQYGVRSIPTLMVFKDGELKSVKAGAMPKNDIKSWISEVA